MKALIQGAIMDARHLLLLRETEGCSSFEILIFARLIQGLKEAEAITSTETRIEKAA
jgi:hypothetical protein